MLPEGARVLGSFTIEKYLGQGSFAHVYLASQDGTRRRAVIKVAHPRMLDHPNREALLRTFAVEFEAATAVVHPNVATLYLVGTLPNGLPAIAMEWVPGPTVESLLHRYGRFPDNVTLRMWLQLASALDAVHGQHIVHQDLSPRNIAVTRHPTTQHLVFKILDFGVSHLPTVNADHRGAGTPAYMAPEQFDRRPCLASDIYALGAMLWWGVTGRELREGLTTDQIARQAAAGSLTAPDPDPLLPVLPVELAMLLVDMLDLDPTRRPTAREISRTLPGLWRSARTRMASAGRAQPDELESPHSTISMELPAMARTNPLVAAARLDSRPATRSGAPLDSIPPARSDVPDTGNWSRPAEASPLDASVLALLPDGPRRDLIETFIGAMPTWLVALEAAAEDFNLDETHRLCRQIGRAADRVGAPRLSALVTGILHMDLPTFIEFRQTETTKVAAEYGEVFRAILEHLEEA